MRDKGASKGSRAYLRAQNELILNVLTCDSTKQRDIEITAKALDLKRSCLLKKTVAQNGFHFSMEWYLRLLWFCIASLFNWSAKFTPL